MYKRAMFDLNESVEYDDDESTVMSNSSVMNADSGGGGTSNAGDDDTSDAFTFNFDILKVGGAEVNNDDEDENRRLTQSESPTRQLFPVTGPNQTQIPVRAECTSANGSSYNNNYYCFDLTFGQHGPAGYEGPKNVNVQQQQQQQPQPQQQQVKKSRRGPRSKSSQYRGVTFYRRTGRWESHIWDCGKQVYLGGFDTAHAAARAYDKAAIKFRGVDADINFPISDYEQEMKLTTNLSKEEFVHILRRQSNGFSRGSSKYRGVTLHKCGRWEARMGQLLGKKAYDKAALKCNGRDAVTNFEPSTYESETVSEFLNEGSQHDLDLNLGISAVPSKKSVENSGMTTLAPPFKELRLASEYPHFWNGGRPHLFLNDEERATGKRIETRSLQGPQNTWQMYDRVNSTPMTMISTEAAAAASSGFSSQVTNVLTGPSSSSNAPYPPSYNLCFTSFPVASSNASQDYYRAKAPPPPP